MNCKKVISNLIPEEILVIEGITFKINKYVENGFIVKEINFEPMDAQKKIFLDKTDYSKSELDTNRQPLDHTKYVNSFYEFKLKPKHIQYLKNYIKSIIIIVTKILDTDCTLCFQTIPHITIINLLIMVQV